MKKILFLLCLGLNIIAAESKMKVFKPLTSTCPASWYDEMKTIAKDVEVITVNTNTNIKNKIGISSEIRSCNTSFFNEYIFEGNVPVSAIKDFLKDVPKNAIGLALPSYENEKTNKTVFIMYEDKTYEKFGKYK